jgi:hypothetical protein
MILNEEDLRNRNTETSDARILKNKIRQALADQKADGLDRSDYIRRLRAQAAELPRKPKSNRKGEPL